MSTHRRLFHTLSIVVVLTMLFSGIASSPVSAQGPDEIERQVNAQTGKVSFLGPQNGQVLPALAALGKSTRPQDPAMELAKRFGPEFGLQDPEQELAALKASRAENGRITARYQQTYQGIPVMGGELIVNTNDNGDLYSINGEVSTKLSLSTRPAITAEQARQSALQAAAKWHQKAPGDFNASEPELWIYDESLLRQSTRPAELVWQMEVTAKDIGVPVRELVLVDAKRGGISLHFNQVDTAWTVHGSSGAVQDPDPTPTPLPTETPTPTETPVPMETPEPEVTILPTETAIHTEGAVPLEVSGDEPAADGAIWYVTTTGNDSNSCSATGSPCATINGALGKAGEGDTIYVASGLYQGSAAIVNITKSITILGGWNSSFNTQTGFSILDAGLPSTTLVRTSMNTVLERLVLRNGGGGINVYNGLTCPIAVSVTLRQSSISGMTSQPAIHGCGTLTLVNTTLSNNQNIAISNFTGNVTIQNSTIANNGSKSGQFVAGGIHSVSGSVTVQNSIISGNTGYGGTPQDCDGSIGSNGHNIIGTLTGCTITPQASDQVGINPQLGSFLPNGYLPLVSNSPAINAGVFCPAVDQRGVSRPQGAACDIGAYEYATPGSAASLVLISGNSQRTAPTYDFPQPLKVVVLDSQDNLVPNVNVTFTAPASGSSGSFAGTGTNTATILSNSSGIATSPILTANSQSGAYTVTAAANGAGSVAFNLENSKWWYVSPTGSDANSCDQPGSPCATISGAMTKAPAGDAIAVASGTYTSTHWDAVVVIEKNLTLSGGWNSDFTIKNGTSIIDAQYGRRGVAINRTDVIAVLDRFTIQNADANEEVYGGGVYNAGTLTINSSTIRNNRITSDSHGGGGGITNTGTLTVNSSTVNQNYQPSSGESGGIVNYGTARLNNSTVSGNQGGAGVYNTGALLLSNSTITKNQFYGIKNIVNTWHNGTTYLRNTIIAGNGLSGDCSGSLITQGYNLLGIKTAECTFTAGTGDRVGTSASPVSPRMTPLQDNGGVTLTHALLPNSPALNAGNPAVPGSGGTACLATDQRGIARPAGTRCDMGAYEGALAAPLYRVSTYTANHRPSLPGVLLCNQNDPSCAMGNFRASAAHEAAIGTYNLYAQKFQRNSLDNNGMNIVSTVDYRRDLNYSYENAFWNGTQVIFGDDPDSFLMADDVAAHELTHGVTQYESNLFYYYQSGAINESISDIWGEYYDQTNVLGNDMASVKWLLGEDVQLYTLEPLRSMSDPTAYGDPDKISSPYYFEQEDDNGGVHINSGVNNKAAYLLVEGGTFNGKTVTALGWDKTLALYYEVNTNLLLSGSDYSDLYYALQQACTNLIGQKGITAGDCTEVRDAVDAVEMNWQPAPNFNTDAPVCAGGSVPVISFADDLETGTANWVFNNGAYRRWQWDSPYASYASSGRHTLYADDFPPAITDARATLRSVVIPTNAYLYFAHAYEFEHYSIDYFDGGIVEYSVNGGATWQDAMNLFEFNGYDGLIYQFWNNPLKGHPAFGGSSHGYISSRLNLASLAGKSVMFRWRMVLDDSGYSLGWWVDNVKIYTCNPVPSAFNKTAPSNGATGIGLSTTLSWSTSSYATSYQYCYDTINDNQCNRAWGSSPTTSVAIANLGTSTTYYWQVRAVNTGATTYADNQSWGSFTTTSTLPAGLTGIEAFIGTSKYGKYSLGGGQSLRESYTGVNNGPVKISSTTSTPLIGAERLIYKVNNVAASFTEMMGLPNSQLDNTYWLPWYNNAELDTQLRFANVSGSTATVHVYIGGNEMTGSPFTLLAGESTRKSFAGVNAGPVKIVSDQNVVAAERLIYKVNNVATSFSETMAVPNSQLDNIYWLPWYNNAELDTQLRFANVSTSPATVHVYIGGDEMPGSPFTLAAGESTRKSFPGVNAGPVQIVSDQNIVAAERLIYKVNNVATSFSEMMALPASQLDTTYWLPWYNNVELDTQLRFGVP